MPVIFCEIISEFGFNDLKLILRSLEVHRPEFLTKITLVKDEVAYYFKK